MIKVMWFLKRTNDQTLEEFHRWWIYEHAPAICKDQSPYLAKYVIDTTLTGAQRLPGSSKGADLEWDGVGIQYFNSEEDYVAVYSRTNRPTTAETMRRVSRKSRLVVVENEIDLSTGLVRPS